MVPAASFPCRLKIRSYLQEKQFACLLGSSVNDLSPSGNAQYLLGGHLDG